MQTFIILGLIIITSFFAMMESKRNSMLSADKYVEFKADAVAGNIMQYSDLVTQYMLANYETLHINATINPGNVEAITPINYQDNQIARYSQKNLQLFLNYTSVSFNYTLAGTESTPLPTLYLASSWDNYAGGIVGYHELNTAEIMGAANQLLNKHIYQGNSVYWTIPWLLKQDGNCGVSEVFGQVPNDSNGKSQLSKIKALFNLFCTQIQDNSSYRFLTYVYIAPVFLPEN